MSDATEQIVDEEVANLMNKARDRARAILTKKRDLLDSLSKLLMVREVLEGNELKSYVEGDKDIPDSEKEAKRLKKEQAARERKARQEAKRKEDVGATHGAKDSMGPLSPDEETSPNGETEDLPNRVR